MLSLVRKGTHISLIQTLLAFLILIFPMISFAEDLSAQQIIDKALAHNSTGFQSGIAKIELAIRSKKGDLRSRKLKVYTKKTTSGVRTKVVLSAPKEVKGQSFLFVEQSGDDDLWMYLPAFRVTRRVAGGQKKGAFLGSHFSYADFESRDIKDANYKKIKEEKIGKHKVYVIEAIPKDANSSDYNRMLVYIRKSDLITLKVKFFKKGIIAKTLLVEVLEKTTKGIVYAKKIKVKASLGGNTTMTIVSLKENIEISDAALSRENLGK